MPNVPIQQAHSTKYYSIGSPRAREPAFSDSMFIDDRRVARANVLSIVFLSEEFDRLRASVLPKGPLLEQAIELANQFLGRLRVFARLPQVKPLAVGQAPWQLEFLTDDGQLLPKSEGMLAIARGGQIDVGVSAFAADAIKTVSDRWQGPEPYVWDQLLLDAYSLMPDIGSAIVMAYAALETFIAWVLETLQTEQPLVQDKVWKWITKRDNFLKEPSVGEQFDTLLEAFTTKSLKSDTALWDTFVELRKARNGLAHEGIPKIDGKIVDGLKAKTLVDGAGNIIKWVEQLLPEKHRRYNTELVMVKRRFATPEEAKLYGAGDASGNISD